MIRSSRLPPFQHRYVDLGGISIHYAELEAEGPPLIMLHGIGMDWRVWQAVSRRLAPFFHLYLVDLRGHGASGKPARGYTLADYAADTEDLLDRLDLTAAILLGSSLGAMVALTVEAPVDLVSHRILVDPPLTGGPVRDEKAFRQILRLKHEPVPALMSYLKGLNPKAGVFLVRIMSEMWHEAADGVLEEMLASPDDYFDVEAALRADEAPTLIMRADPAQGGVLSAEQAERAKQQLPRGELVYLPGVGHAIHAEEPAEFVKLVREFTGVD